ncbi:hypothetical protein ACO0LE_20220, partial [Undibacterium sp. Xuan67W]
MLPAGLLLCVTDSYGQQIQFEYDEKNRISKIVTPGNLPYVYEYDGASGGCSTFNFRNVACYANNLTKVTFPDGKYRTYVYNEASQINSGNACPNNPGISAGLGHLLNSLTSIVDENGARYTSWNYDCSGRAVGDQLFGDVNKLTIAFSAVDLSNLTSTSSVTNVYGPVGSSLTTTHQLTFKYILGVPRVIDKDHPCAECGTIKSY